MCDANGSKFRFIFRIRPRKASDEVPRTVPCPHKVRACPDNRTWTSSSRRVILIWPRGGRMERFPTGVGPTKNGVDPRAA